MPYNYSHPDWKENDREFIKSLETDLEYYEKINKKYAFNTELRKSILETRRNLTDLITREKKEFEEKLSRLTKNLAMLED